MKNLVRLLAPSLALLFALMPVFCDYARADSSRSVIHVSVGTTTTTTPGGGVSVTANFDDIRDPAESGGRGIEAAIDSDWGSASFHWNRDAIKTGDGYSLQHKIVADTAQQTFIELSLFTPTNDTVTAHLRVNKATQQVFSGDLAPLSQALQGSHDFTVIAAALPTLQAALRANHGPSHAPSLRITTNALTKTDNDLLGCIMDAVAETAAIIGVILACGAPEPLEPIACAVAIMGMTAGAIAVGDACSD